MSTCSGPNCERPSERKGLCDMHYRRVRRTGTTADPARATPVERFWSHVEKTEACWNWTAATNDNGYGFFKDGTKSTKAHRFSYELHRGPIPEGKVVDHICRTPGCVKPTHLRLATQKQNCENLGGANASNVTSGVRGVYRTRNGKWQARVTHAGKIYTAGTHDTIELAGDAVILLRNSLHTHNDVDRRAA